MSVLLRRTMHAGHHRDILLEDGFVAAIGSELDTPSGTVEIDASDKWFAPAFLDLHTHLREPGFEYKEDIATASLAATAGGFGALCPMPNTDPAPDAPEVLDRIEARSRAVGLGVRIIPVGAATIGNARKEPADYEALAAAGARMIADDPYHIFDDGLFRECLSRAREVALPFQCHCEIPGARGEPDEPRAVERACLLAGETGAHLHIGHLSTRDGAALVREAKADGIRVTSEVCPHHLVLTDDDIADLGAIGKVGPCLKTAKDAEALVQALLAGEFDALATDHAPHADEEKARPFRDAPPGMLGLEFALAMAHAALWERAADPTAWNTAVEHLSRKPWGVLGLEPPPFAVGERAFFTLVEFGATEVGESWIHSRSRNCPYLGRPAFVRPWLTALGRFVHQRDLEGRFVRVDGEEGA